MHDILRTLCVNICFFFLFSFSDEATCTNNVIMWHCGIRRENNETSQTSFTKTDINTHIYCCFYHFQDDLTGQAILEVAFGRLNLIETAYFGVRYMDEENQTVSCIIIITN